MGGWGKRRLFRQIFPEKKKQSFPKMDLTHTTYMAGDEMKYFFVVGINHVLCRHCCMPTADGRPQPGNTLMGIPQLEWVTTAHRRVVELIKNIFLNVPNSASFLFIFVLFSTRWKYSKNWLYKWQKCGWCARDSNPRPQACRHRQIHWSMAANK